MHVGLRDVLSTTRGRTVVVPFAVPPPSISHAALAELLRRHELPDDFLFMPNQFWKHKNHAVVIEALALRVNGVVRSSSRRPAIRLTSGTSNIRPVARECSVARPGGPVPVSRHAALCRGAGPMASCRALINPSLFEGWSTTVEEAKALGVPMVLSDLAVHASRRVSRQSILPRRPQRARPKHCWRPNAGSATGISWSELPPQQWQRTPMSFAMPRALRMPCNLRHADLAGQRRSVQCRPPARSGAVLTEGDDHA